MPFSYNAIKMKRGEFMVNPNYLNNNMNKCFCFKSYFRLLNAIVGSPAIDVYLNEMLISSNLKYGEFSRYVKLMPGNYKIVVYPSGNQKEAIFETDIIIGKNLAYTGVLAGRITDISNLSIFMIPDAKEDQTMNRMSAVKIVNLIPDTVPLDLVAEDGTVLFSGIEYGETTGNVALPSGAYTLHLRVKGDDKNILTAPNIDFAPKMYYTLFIIGEYGANGAKPKIEIIIPEDGLNYLDLC